MFFNHLLLKFDVSFSLYCGILLHTIIQYVCDSFAFTFAKYFPSYCCLSKFICLCHISSLMFLSIPSLMFSFSPHILPLISPYISPPLIFSPVSPNLYLLIFRTFLRLLLLLFLLILLLLLLFLFFFSSHL